MWAFLFLCVLSLNQGFSKKLELFLFPLSVSALLLQAAPVKAGLGQTDHHVPFCVNSRKAWGRSSVEQFHKLCRATLSTNPKLVTNLGKVGVCAWTGWTTKLSLHRGPIPARMAAHVLWNTHNYLPFWAQHCFRKPRVHCLKSQAELSFIKLWFVYFPIVSFRAK